jgi:hypothetical protein
MEGVNDKELQAACTCYQQPQITANNKTGPQLYDSKETNSTNNLKELDNRSFPSRASDENTLSSNTRIIASAKLSLGF